MKLLVQKVRDMRLAKVLLSSGERRVAVWEDQSLRLLDLSQVDNCRSLSDILHSPDPKGISSSIRKPIRKRKKR